MNQDDRIQEIWQRMKSEKKEITVEAIEQAMRPSVKRQGFTLKVYIWFWLTVISATLVMGGMNIVGYAGNAPMLAAQISITLIAFAFGAYGIHLLNEIVAMDRADESMTQLLHRRIRFYHSKYEIWNLMMAALCPILSFAVNTYVDNENGIYRINKPFVFWGTILLQVLFVYAALKIGQYPLLKEIKVYLADLEAQVLEGTSRLPEMKRRWRLWTLILVVILGLLLLWGVWEAMRFAPRV